MNFYDFAVEAGTHNWPVKRTPTNMFRFLKKGDQKILQQLWIRESRLSTYEDWRDVPEVEE